MGNKLSTLVVENACVLGTRVVSSVHISIKMHKSKGAFALC